MAREVNSLLPSILVVNIPNLEFEMKVLSPSTFSFNEGSSRFLAL